MGNEEVVEGRALENGGTLQTHKHDVLSLGKVGVGVGEGWGYGKLGVRVKIGEGVGVRVHYVGRE